ncbi:MULTISPECIES: hypothetical protein [unclassified Aureimonas]|uniref:hypothetical protein n=1 Tax=unclassified Aureimonas TaxID=2615206 RepID=UPI0007011A4F|nr:MULTISPECIES: hypothetical protein [unclassified Aureimonas]KQT56209.1 hypothetical protein ASG62_24985 [Aureimonas sp. Leaf427]KQT78355.1 hypothetical protein ASG54_10725 [Aureimonas sp. Leaf460]
MPFDAVLFLIALLISCASAGLVVSILYRPLLRVIVDLCGTEERARFWTTYTSIILMLSPVLAVSFAMSTSDDGRYDPQFLQNCVFWSAAALMAALMVFGFALWKPSIRLFDIQQDERTRSIRQAATRHDVVPQDASTGPV